MLKELFKRPSFEELLASDPASQAGSKFQIYMDITPLVATNPESWLVSTWRNLTELDVAPALGFAVWHWMEITVFKALDLQPEARCLAGSSQAVGIRCS